MMSITIKNSNLQNLISGIAFETIKHELNRSSSRSGKELGGIIYYEKGKLQMSNGIIGRQTEITVDVGGEMNKVKSKNPKAKFVGAYHTHPPGKTSKDNILTSLPSIGDIKTLEKHKPLLMIIASKHKHEEKDRVFKGDVWVFIRDGSRKYRLFRLEYIQTRKSKRSRFSVVSVSEWNFTWVKRTMHPVEMAFFLRSSPVITTRKNGEDIVYYHKEITKKTPGTSNDSIFTKIKDLNYFDDFLPTISKMLKRGLSPQAPNKTKTPKNIRKILTLPFFA